jgi:EpsI family protein
MIMGASKKAVFIGLLFIVVSASAAYLKPTKKLADSMPAVNLEKMIPAQFGDWRTDTVVLEQIVSPERKVLLAHLYNQTLSRAYLDGRGNRVMLSIAYGGDESDGMQVHRPEVCYAAQGFQVEKDWQDTLPTKFGSLPVERLLAVQGGRIEPITYWITVGDTAVITKGIHQKFAQLRYGLTGKVPDGMLVRVSLISSDEKEAYRTLDDFIKAMIDALSKEDRVRIAGKFEG